MLLTQHLAYLLNVHSHQRHALHLAHDGLGHAQHHLVYGLHHKYVMPRHLGSQYILHAFFFKAFDNYICAG